MSRNVDVRAICPFFEEEPSCGHSIKQHKAHERIAKRRIRCEGLSPGGKILLEFSSEREKREHCENFCYSKCWRGCPLAQVLMDNYEKRGG